MIAPLLCPKCQAHLPDSLPFPGAARPCPKCHAPVEGLVFPAYHRPSNPGKAAEAIITAEDAGCFYHPQSRATVPCDICGRFLCALCDIELNGGHICPGCVETGRKKSLMPGLDGDRVLYGRIALMVALLPILIWPFTIVTGPAAVFMGIYGWTKKGRLTGDGHAGHVIAILLGLIQSVIWVFVIINIFR